MTYVQRKHAVSKGVASYGKLELMQEHRRVRIVYRVVRAFVVYKNRDIEGNPVHW